MVAKLAVSIIAIGATFGALLVIRQQRIDAVAEISRAQLRMALHDKTIARLQSAVAHAIRPDELKMLAFAQPVEWEQIPYRFSPTEQHAGKPVARTPKKSVPRRTASATQERSR